MDMVESKENNYYVEDIIEMGNGKDKYVSNDNTLLYTESPLQGFASRLKEFDYINFTDQKSQYSEEGSHRDLIKWIAIISLILLLSIVFVIVRTRR